MWSSCTSWCYDMLILVGTGMGDHSNSWCGQAVLPGVLTCWSCMKQLYWLSGSLQLMWSSCTSWCYAMLIMVGPGMGDHTNSWCGQVVLPGAMPYWSWLAFGWVTTSTVNVVRLYFLVLCHTDPGWHSDGWPHQQLMWSGCTSWCYAILILAGIRMGDHSNSFCWVTTWPQAFGRSKPNSTVNIYRSVSTLYASVPKPGFLKTAKPTLL